MKRLCVFCGSNSGTDPVYTRVAAELGGMIAARGGSLVYGGGATGMMGTVASAVLAAGGEAIGVIPDRLLAREVAHKGLTQLHVVASMHARKAMMAELSDGFVALPGGFGTLEELFEVITWSQLGIHVKPIGILNVAGYFDKLLAFMDSAIDAGFIRREYRGLYVVATTPYEMLERLPQHVPPSLQKWIEPDTSKL